MKEQRIHHDEARSWLDRSLSGEAIVGFAWVALLAFVRLATKTNDFPHPLDTDFARFTGVTSVSPATA